MTTREVVRDFDRISPAYDATREPLEPTALDRMADQLRAGGVTSILEIGVGTGRIARPLLDRGFEVTGLDASWGMLSRARSKQLPRLVRGSAYRLPFDGGAFDATLFVHVLHLLDRPLAALSDAGRVSRRGTFALVRPHGDPLGQARDAHRARRIVYRILAEQGYPMPSRGDGPGGKEREILTVFPPDELTVVFDRSETAPLARPLEMFSRRAHRHTLDIPGEVVDRAVAAARKEVGDATFTFRRVETLAQWRVPLRPPVAA